MPDFPVVGLGASAGGIQAFRTFFEHVPADSGMAYVVILHLSPEHESRLAEILQTSARMPVSPVRDREPVQPNRVYVISPRESLTMSDGHFVQSPMTRVEERRAPIDIFFRTLAESHEGAAVCVVLSGTGSDGSMGLKRIKERGGICLVQDPDEAEHDEMPRNALATHLVDVVLPVARMPQWIADYWQLKASVTLPEWPEGRQSRDEEALHAVLVCLRQRTGHDFANYKRATLLRRLERRISVRRQPDLASYAEFIRDHPEEAQALLKDLLISVTSFFRDAGAFTALEAIVPRLFEDKREDDQVRVWVPGCATGEEAYSIGMLLCDYAAALPGAPPVQIFATDIDEIAIATAREGLYSAADVADVPQDRLRRYFVKEGDSYRVRKELRDTVLFALHNAIKDPPFSHLDLVSCRNLLIYLNRTGQQRVLDTIHFALNSGGYLFVGSSESVEGAGDRFAIVDKDAHLFQSRGVAGRPGTMLTAGTGETPIPELRRMGPMTGRRGRERLVPADLHHRLLEQLAPPSVVVDENHEIVHLSETAGQYLQFAGGEPTTNLVRAVRPELRLELRSALYQAAQHRRPVEARGLTVRLADGSAAVDIEVRPVVRDGDAARGFFVVLFARADSANAADESAAEPVSTANPAGQLEEELLRLKEQLRTTVEQHETQTEELKASNEELQAINEELRSATEELETSREELQSLNEELRTVNQELKVKVEEQTQSRNDILNLVNSTDFGTVFLDRGGRIKLFTPRAREIFSLIATDIGRPLNEINSHLAGVDLQRDIDEVLDTLNRVQREVATRDGRLFLMRVTPYRTSDDRIDGVVLTCVDMTAHQQAADRLRQSEERLRRALQVDTVGVLFFAMSGTPTDANDAFLRMSGLTRETLQEGWPAVDGLPAETLAAQHRALHGLAVHGHAEPFEAEYRRPDGKTWWALVAPTRLNDRECAEFVIDITERRDAEEALRQGDRRKNEFLATLAHELRNPLAPIATALQIQRMSPLDSPAAAHARATIERQIVHMVRLVEDLVEVSRVTQGKIELRREELDVSDAIAAALESMGSQRNPVEHQLSVRLSPAPLRVNADPVRLTQVFVNLLNNAAKFTPPGGRIEVSSARDGDTAVIAVKDDGIGIPAPLLPRVFDMFTQGEDPPV